MNYINGELRWGIIGCGDVCEVKSGPAFNKVQNSRLVAVMRRDKDKAKDFARRHGVSKFYDDVQQLIDDSEVNAIYIATPPSFHEEYAIRSMASGKPVYIEKPISVSEASVMRMIDASQKYKQPAVTAHYRRGLPLFKKVKSLIEEGILGDIRLIMIKTLQPAVTPLITQTHDNWRVNPALSGGGLFHDLSPHQLDILYWIFGEPVEVRGYSLNQKKKYNAPDVTSLELVFADSIFMQGIWSFNMPEFLAEDTCRIIGDKGSLSFSFFRNPGLELEIAGEGGSKKLDFSVPENIQLPMIEETVKYFRGEIQNPCSLQEALVTMKIMDSTI